MHQPLTKLSTEPSTQPLTKPSNEPSTQPVTQPSTQMSAELPTQLSTEPSVESSTQCPAHREIGFNDLLVKIRNIGGLNCEVFCNLRIPNKFQTDKDEISLIILTGRGVFCIDVKDWQGEVTQYKGKWYVIPKKEDTSVRQFADPIQAIKIKATNLQSHLEREGVFLESCRFLAKVLLLSPNCLLSPQLRTREEVVTYSKLDAFLHSFHEDFMTWAVSAFLPSWMLGYLSKEQLQGTREVLRRTGTWDQVQLRDGSQLQGDYQDCTHLAMPRKETDEVEFSGPGILASLWEKLGYTPMVEVKMYRRGKQGRFIRHTISTASIPQSSQVVFRINGKEMDARICVDQIQSITLSI